MERKIAIRTIAEWLHTNYEELAELFQWETQKSTQVKFNQLPDTNKQTMIVLAERLVNLINEIGKIS